MIPPTGTSFSCCRNVWTSSECCHDNDLEKLRHRNIELQRQLNEAKQVIRSHEEQLLVYSQIINGQTSNICEYDLKWGKYVPAMEYHL